MDDTATSEADTVITLVIGITATLGLVALGVGGGVLGKPPPPRWGGPRSSSPARDRTADKPHTATL